MVSPKVVFSFLLILVLAKLLDSLNSFLQGGGVLDVTPTGQRDGRKSLPPWSVSVAVLRAGKMESRLRADTVTGRLFGMTSPEGSTDEPRQILTLTFWEKLYSAVDSQWDQDRVLSPS